MTAKLIFPTGRRRRLPWPRPRARQHASALPPGLFALALLCSIAEPAAAQPVTFTPAEQALIARNASLRAAVNLSPSTVRQILDALAASQTQNTAQDAAQDTTRASHPTQAGQPSGPAGSDFEQAADPDLSDLQRVSPEAAHDVFLVLKQVASTRPATPPK